MVPQALSALSPFGAFRAGSSRTALTLTIAILLTSWACEKVPLTAPAGTVITLVAATNVLPLNGTTELIAVLIENGTSGTGNNATPSAGTPVHNGTLVTFTTSLGRIEPAEARTNNGRVTVKLIADGRSGIATINAFSGSAANDLEVTIGAAATARVGVASSEPSVPANGGTVTISAIVEDASGNPLFGVPVTFTTTAGTLNPVSALTNENGIAASSLSTTAEATVTASAGGKTGTATIKVRSRSTISLTPPTGSNFVGAAALFTISPVGTTVPFKNVTIYFGDGESRSLGAITSITTEVKYYTNSGVFPVSVVGTDVDGGTASASASVAVVPIAFTLDGTPSNGTGTVTTPFRFTVSGLPATVPIQHYIWDFGDGPPTTNTSNTVTHFYTTPGVKTITVTVVPLHGSSKTTSIQIFVAPM